VKEELVKLLLMTAAAMSVGLVGFGTWSIGLLLGRPGDVGRLASELGLQPGSSVADVGAGSGGWTFRLAELVGATGRVYATEVDPAKLDALRHEVTKRGLANVTVLQAGERATHLPDGSCDAIVLRGVYHHLQDPAAFQAEARRALRSGGRLAIVDFAPDGPWRWHFVFDSSGDAAGPRHGHGVPARDVAREGVAAGFQLVRQIEGWSGGYHLTVFRR
jgi:ubiquinone/menaquinone biosynthesis C-methylase UbiE